MLIMLIILILLLMNHGKIKGHKIYIILWPLIM
jgi:hypothetical protein